MHKTSIGEFQMIFGIRDGRNTVVIGNMQYVSKDRSTSQKLQGIKKKPRCCKTNNQPTLGI